MYIFENYGSNVVYFSCQLTACITLRETVQNLRYIGTKT